MARDRDSRRAPVSMRKWSENVEVFGSKSVKLPEGVGRIRIKQEGNRWFNFIPYTAGPRNPNCDEGGRTPELMYWAHRNVGPAEDLIVCSAKSFGKPCFVCEERERLRKESKASEDMLKTMFPSPRQLFNVEDTDNEPGKLQVWDHSFHLFGKQLKHKLDSARDEDDKFDYFADPERGYVVKIYFTKRPGGFGFEATNIEFRKRGEPISEDLLKQAIMLEDCLVETPYDKVKRLYLQQPDEAEDERAGRGKGKAAAPAKAAGKAKAAAEEDEDEEEEEDEEVSDKKKGKEAEYAVGDYVTYKKKECEVIKVSGDGTSLTLEDEDGTLFKRVGPDEVTAVPTKGREEDEEDEEEEEAPPKKKGKAKAAAEEDEDEEEDEEESFEEEEDEEEEEAPPKKRRK